MAKTKYNHIISTSVTDEQLDIIQDKILVLMKNDGKIYSVSEAIRILLLSSNGSSPSENVSKVSDDTKSQDDSQNVTQDAGQSKQPDPFELDIEF